MRVFIILSILCLVSHSSCKTEEHSLPAEVQCNSLPSNRSLSRLELVNLFDEEIVEGLASANRPDVNGALGRNKDAYFHVRFQMGIASIADYAVYSKREDMLDMVTKAIEYSFEHQTSAGDFELVIPSQLASQAPTVADKASGVAFFLSALSVALNNFSESSWYNGTSHYKQRIENLRPDIARAAAWLLTQRTVLAQTDAHAPNRLFFDALAFYGLGKWLHDNQLKEAGIDFAKMAMATQHKSGYFVEGSGWDSSYQGVGMFIGLNLFSLMDSNEVIRNALWSSLSCATQWQFSRISDSGEISTEGNARVYPGGETFLGEEKTIAWKDTMSALLMMSYYTGQVEVYNIANRVKEYYR